MKTREEEAKENSLIIEEYTEFVKQMNQLFFLKPEDKFLIGSNLFLAKKQNELTEEMREANRLKKIIAENMPKF
ncbi:hypothetical protein [Flavobacterium sp. J27]|uniref:hypothetical protein n=1 Tax=Flavobacterium sp. J27 TaxID=2060419 RepID=UPI00102F5A51|nr:hypothetical protein [Flavobacterium sp. J27]